MGIKDKVLDILFDDDDEQVNKTHIESVNHTKKDVKASTFLDTGSIFIDATSPLPKSNNNNHPQNNVEQEYHEPNPVGENGYQLSENISPIFGIIDGKNKKSKNISKIKSYNDVGSTKLDSSNQKQTPPYTSVVISPIFGPITTKPVKKSSKPRKKAVDPFERDINDTGNFDAVINEDDEIIEPQFDDVEIQEDFVEETTTGDTDRLERISDKINKIKNEAANIYYEDDTINNTIEEDEYKVETVEHESISDVIHNVQKHDERIEHHPINNNPAPEVVENTNVIPEQPQEQEDSFQTEEDNVTNIEEPIENTQPINEDSIEQEVTTFEEPDKSDDFISNEPNNTENTASNSQVSVDDIFQDEDVEEGKDLFSVLFGDD